jgi:hypothetical protein
MLRISFTNDNAVIQALRDKGPAIVRAIVNRVNEVMITLQSYVVTEKLSGQVLQRRTGILAGSIRAIPAAINGTTITGSVEGGGGSAFYGVIHESGPEQGAYPIVAVKARALAFMMDGRKVFVKSVMHPAVKPRPFMGPSQDENADYMETQIRAAVDEEIAKP